MTLNEGVKPVGHRFAFVAGWLDLGGSTTYLCNLTTELSRRGHAVLVVSLQRNHPLANDFAQAGVPVIVQDDLRLVYEDRLQNVLHAIRAFQPTAVVAWIGTPACEVLRYVPTSIGRVVVLHGDKPSVYTDAAPYTPHTDVFVVVARRMADVLATRKSSATTRILYIPTGIPLPANIPDQAGKDRRSLRVLYLGRLDRDEKRVWLFPRIFQQLCTTGIPFVWTVAGDGTERLALQRQMESPSPHQRVDFLGAIPYSAVPELLCRHDVLLLTSESEGMPLALLEAMARGLVPVVSDLPGGIREVVDESNGRLVRVDDVDGYARAIDWLHTHREEMTTMSRVSEQRVRDQFSMQAMTDQWLAMAPSEPMAAANWPRKFAIRRPLVHPWPWAFFEPFKTGRRIVKRLRATVSL